MVVLVGADAVVAGVDVAEAVVVVVVVVVVVGLLA